MQVLRLRERVVRKSLRNVVIAGDVGRLLAEQKVGEGRVNIDVGEQLRTDLVPDQRLERREALL